MSERAALRSFLCVIFGGREGLGMGQPRDTELLGDLVLTLLS